MRIRPATADDAGAIATIRAAALPYLVGSPAGVRARLADEESAGWWVASVDGEPVGFSQCRRPHDRGARVVVTVQPAHTGEGVGSALLEVAVARVRELGGRRVNAVADGPGGLAFARAHGFAVGREHRFARSDLAAAPEPPDPPPGVELRPLDAVDPRAIWALHEAVAPDDPSGMSISQPYETWYAEDWDYPDHAADLGRAALLDGEVVAFTHVFADRGRGAIWSAMTGVAPAVRGHGLARLVKIHALAGARAAGMTDAYTANDAGNAPMLAVNAALGYRPAATAWSVSRAA